MKPISIKGQLVIDYIKKFPNTPNLTLAKKIYKENSKLFIDVENVRSIIRTYTGNTGKNNAKKVKDKSDGLEPIKNKDEVSDEELQAAKDAIDAIVNRNR
jgi:hypothetical protein